MSVHKVRFCPYCLAEFTNLGLARKSPVCSSCYSLHRKADVLWYSAKTRAQDKELPFSLSKVWIFHRLKEPCSKTGIQYDLNFKGGNFKTRSPWSPSIDRISPSKGYTEENCRMVCWWYNSAKQQFSDEEVLTFCKLVVNFSERNLALGAERKVKIETEIT